MKRAFLLLLISMNFLTAECQWTYVGLLSDTCEISTSKFEIKNTFLTPSSGWVYSVYDNNELS